MALDSPVNEGLVFVHPSVSISGADAKMRWKEMLPGLRAIPEDRRRVERSAGVRCCGFPFLHHAEVKPRGSEVLKVKLTRTQLSLHNFETSL